MISFDTDCATVTEDGLDAAMSLVYYARMRFLIKLLPQLLASKQTAHVIDIFAPGTEANLIEDDLALLKPGNYKFLNVRSHTTYMKTLLFEKLAEQHPGKLALCHHFPHYVETPLFFHSGYPWWFQILWHTLAPIFKLFSMSEDECGNRMLYMATDKYPARQEPGTLSTEDAGATQGSDGKRGSGAYAVGPNNDPLDIAKHYEKFDREDIKRKLWDHTMNVFETVEAGKTYKV